MPGMSGFTAYGLNAIRKHPNKELHPQMEEIFHKYEMLNVWHLCLIIYFVCGVIITFGIVVATFQVTQFPALMWPISSLLRILVVSYLGIFVAYYVAYTSAVAFEWMNRYSAKMIKKFLLNEGGSYLKAHQALQEVLPDYHDLMSSWQVFPRCSEESARLETDVCYVNYPGSFYMHENEE